MEKIALTTHKIAKHFNGVHAVDDLSITFTKGKITGLVGPNGSGKSTLINLLTGLISLDEGFVMVDGSGKIFKLKPNEVADLGITRTFQDVKLFEQMTVLDNILVVMTKRNVVSALFEKHKYFHIARAIEVLERVGLKEKKDELANTLSYGQRKLLEIGRVLAMIKGSGENCDIFLFDEPYAGLFSEMRDAVTNILQEIRQSGKTVVLIEHNMEIIRQTCDYLYVLDSGKLLAEGEPEKVLNNKEVVSAYLGE